MHGIAQVMQQLANDLPLVFLLYAAQGGGVGRGAGRGETRFQVLFSVGPARAELSHGLVSSARSLKKLPAGGRCGNQRSVWQKIAGFGQYMLLLRRHKHLLCSAAYPPTDPHRH